MKTARHLSYCLLLAGCATTSATRSLRLPPTPVLLRADPRSVGMARDLGARLDSIIAVGIAQGAAPGVALAVGRFGRLVHLRAYGRIDTGSVAPIVTDSTLFDMASLTKVVATTTAAMILEDEDKLDLDAPVRSCLPELDYTAKSPITVRMILPHSGGFEAFAPPCR